MAGDVTDVSSLSFQGLEKRHPWRGNLHEPGNSQICWHTRVSMEVSNYPGNPKPSFLRVLTHNILRA